MFSSGYSVSERSEFPMPIASGISNGFFESKYRITLALCLYRSDYMASRAFFSAYLPASRSPEIELVVVDNNPSADRSYILKLLGPRIRYLPNPRNVTLFGSSLRAWREARGEFVIFLGDDDFLDPFFIDNFTGMDSRIIRPECDIVASAPTEFEHHSKVKRLTRSAEDIMLMSHRSISSRVQAALRWRYSSYLLWSLYRRSSVNLDVQFSFYAFCPGYTVGLDWPTIDGFLLLHQVQQLEYGYYVYNRSNWDTSGQNKWMRRELQSFRKALKGSSLALSDSEVLALRSVNLAAIAASYFLALLQDSRSRLPNFNEFEYLSGASLILSSCYLNQFKFGDFDWSNVCQPSFQALLELIKILCLPLQQHLSYGEDLAAYLLTVPHNYSPSLDEDLYQAYECRYRKWHHVEIEGLMP